MFKFMRMPLLWLTGVGVLIAATTAALLTPAAEPAPARPSGLLYVPTDAAVFGHIDFEALWKSEIGDTFRKAKLGEMEKGLQQLQALTSIKLEDLATLTAYIPKIKDSPDLQTAGVVVTTNKPYNREFIKNLLQLSNLAKTGKTEVKDHVIRITSKEKDQGPSVFVDLTDDKVIVFALNLKAEPKADANRANGPHSAALKAASGAVLVGGLNFANLPDEIRRDEANFPATMRPFVPIIKCESVALHGKLSGKELKLALSFQSPSENLAQDVEKSLDLLRNLAQIGVSEATKELDQAEKKDESLKAFRPLLKAVGEMVKSSKLENDQRTNTAHFSLPTNLPYGSLVEYLSQSFPASNTRDQNNLKQLVLALHNYHDAMGALPPSYLVDKKGKPTLSWRVMVLPYVEQQNLYMKFKLDEPWDSEHNMKVYKENPIPQVFLNSDDKAEDKLTRYRVFNGSGAGFEPTGKLKFTNFTDGTSNTIAIVTAEKAVPWTKPEELEFDPDKDVKPLLHFRGDRCNFAMFDGSVQTLRKTVSEVTLKALITRGGGEVPGDDR